MEWQRLMGKEDPEAMENERGPFLRFFTEAIEAILDEEEMEDLNPLTYSVSSCYLPCGLHHCPCGLPYKHDRKTRCDPNPEPYTMGKRFHPSQSLQEARNVYEGWCGRLGIYEDALALVALYIPLMLVGSEAETLQFRERYRRDPFSDTSESEDAEDDEENGKPRELANSSIQTREGSSVRQGERSQGVSS